MENLDQLLERIIEVIVAEVQPEQIILFGSRADGSANVESDYDLMVVVRGDVDERMTSRRIYRALFRERIPAAVDVVVVNAASLRRRRTRHHDVARWALEQGRIVHVA
ncbi:MAG: nucleotidyltransferase domain-containing protein [Pseudomonadota bacterium]